MGSAEGTTVWRRQLHILAVALLGPVRHRWWKRGRPASPVVISRLQDVASWGGYARGPESNKYSRAPGLLLVPNCHPSIPASSSCGKVGAAAKAVSCHILLISSPALRILAFLLEK